MPKLTKLERLKRENKRLRKEIKELKATIQELNVRALYDQDEAFYADFAKVENLKRKY